MEYNDEAILSIGDYEQMAKAYAMALKSKGFMIVQVSDGQMREQVEEIFERLFKIKSLLFALGGFLNTSQFYSLNERQIKKLALLFDFQGSPTTTRPPRDKTKCFLAFLAEECLLIKNLISLAENSNYENHVKDLVSTRLTKLNEILTL